MNTYKEKEISPYYVAGASIIGHYHVENGTSNEDSLGIYENKEAVVLAVADGVGSVAFPKIGSQRVVQAVYDATKIWLKKEGASKEHLLQLVYALFRLSISEYDRHDCATTCLFAVYVKNSHRLIVAQIGDGVVYGRIGHEEVILTEPKTGFVNATLPITSIKNVKSWRSFEFDVKDKPFELFLATDGVSECINEANYASFLASIKEKVQRKERLKTRNNIIRKFLRGIHKTESMDDKTLAIICRGDFL